MSFVSPSRLAWLLVAGLAGGLNPRLASAALPDAFSITVTNAGQLKVLQLERYNLRGPSFHVRIYTDETTNFTTLHPLPEVSTYRGRIVGDPRAVVSAVVKPNGKLRAQVVYGNWYQPVDPALGTLPWSVDNVPTPYLPENTYAYALATNMPSTLAAGTYPGFTNGFGGPRYLNNMQKFTPRRCRIALDVVYDFFVNTCGSDLYNAIAQAESKLNDADLVTARDNKIAYQITCIAVRTTTMAPYTASGTSRLGNLSSFWTSQRASTPYDKVAAFTSIGGGVAYLWGDFSLEEASWYGGVVCHEVGHNWGALDYEATKDYTGTNGYQHAMNGSGLTYCPESVNRAQQSVRGKSYEHEWIRYNYPLPPYAAPDYATTRKNTARTVDVLFNDYDVNSNTLSVVWFSTNTSRGGSVALTGGQLRYTPPNNFVGTDTFLYRISDGTGYESGTQVMVLVTDPSDALLAQYTFDQTNGVTATEASGRGVSGKLSGGLDFAQDGVPGLSGRALHFDGSGYAELLNNYDPLDSSFTVSVWVKPDATPASAVYLLKKGYGGDAWGGCNLVADGTSFRLYGNMFGNSDGSKFSVVAGVTPKPDTWYHVVGQLDRTNNLARLWVNGVEYTGTSSSRSLAANGVLGEYVVGNGTLTLGNSFQGVLEDLRIYAKALSAAEITTLYTAAGNLPAGGPVPTDGERDVPLLPALSWLPGRTNYQHDVFLGTNRMAVLNASTNSPEYQGRRSVTNFTPAAALLPATDYYWRVDEVLGGANVAGGEVWSFRTAVDSIHGGLRLQLSLDARDTVGTNTYDRGGPPFEDAALYAAPNPVAGRVRQGFDFNGTSQFAEAPALNLNTDTLTLTAWVKRNGSQISYAGLVFCRGGSTVSGLDLRGTSNQLGYHWNDASSSYNYASGLTLPDGEWAFAALTVEPARAIFYLGRTNGVLSAATNNVSHGLSAFNGPLRVASDSSSGRLFKGAVDEVCVWRRALSRLEIGQLLTNGINGLSLDGPGTPPVGGSFTWLGAADAYWNNPGNWFSGSLPASTNTAIFSDAATQNLDTQLGQDFSLAGILVTGGLRGIGISSTANALTLGAGGLQISNSFASVTLGAPVTLGASQTWSIPAYAALDLNASITNAGRTLVLSNAGSVTLDAAFRGSGGLTINGGGTVTVNANSAHSGQTIVNDATLVLAKGNWYSGSDLGTGTLVINSNGWVRTTTTHVFDAGGSNPIRIYGGRLTFAAESYVNSSFEMTGGLFDGQGEWRVQGNPTFRAAATPATVEAPQNWLGGSRTLTVENGNADPDAIISGPLYNGVNFTKAGAGTLSLRQAVAHTGATTVSGGVLELAGGENTLPATTSLTLSGGAILRVRNLSQTLAGLAGTGTIDLGTNALILTGAVSNYLNGQILGTAAQIPPAGDGDGLHGIFGLTKGGPGTLHLTGNSPYTGDTLVNAGTLMFSGSGTLASSNLTIAAGAVLDVRSRTGGIWTPGAGQTLRGLGSVRGTINVANGAAVSPGLSPGTLVTSNVIFSAGGTYVWEINDLGSDLLAISGGLSIPASSSSRFTVRVVTPDGPITGFNPLTPQAWMLASTTQGITGFNPASFTVDAAGFTNALSGGTFNVAQQGSNLLLQFTPAPPPGMGSLSFLPNGTLQLSVTGAVGQSVILLGATNLAPPLWQPLLTNLIGPGGTLTLTDPQSTNLPGRFYRLQTP